MAITNADIAAWAARIRPHFDESLQDTAERAAYEFALAAGSSIRALRPETCMSEILAWLNDARRRGYTSQDWVETLLAIEVGVSSELPDAFAANLECRTFREYVEQLQVNRRHFKHEHSCAV